MLVAGSAALVVALVATVAIVVSRLDGGGIGPSMIRLQWTDNATDEDGFTIYNGETTRDVGPNTTTYDWGGLAAGTYMCFKVRSRHFLGVSAYHPADPNWVCRVRDRPEGWARAASPACAAANQAHL